ncbi:YdcF family protein [Acinetobacter gerneri]|uniref:YdcF family protein n=1 Tax=Acinetobacter gerneri TaxID=202952 RepID=UPI002936930D|nr:YdcF family protein [Acinetobacter gerneri]MDV2441919.1 YdcF family protein [Acinetobacter gerneri]
MKFKSFKQILFFIIGLILFLDGLILIALKKLHLGTILPFFIGLFFCVYAIFYKKIHLFLNQRSTLNKFWKMGWTLFSLWAISLVGFFIYLSQSHQNISTDFKPQAIIVLGSGISQGIPTPTLAMRLDQAAVVAKHNPNAWMILSGGLDFGEKITEASAMKHYLIEKYQLDPNKLLEESKSTSTELNLKNSQMILEQQGLNQHATLAIVTSDFHTLRAASIARKQGYDHFQMISAPTPLSTRYNAWLREYFAYISGWVLKEY